MLGFRVTHNEELDWDLMWLDGGVTPDRLMKMKAYQRANHFPGMYALARKNFLGRNLMKMLRQFPAEYNFFPKTWCLPAEYSDFKQNFVGNRSNKAFILKPEALSQGKGIFITKSLLEVDATEHYVAQQYLHKPYLIEGLKFDLRIYVLLAGVDPLRIFLYKEGLGRFATENYSPPRRGNMKNLFTHLTNYAINKESDKF